MAKYSGQGGGSSILGQNTFYFSINRKMTAVFGTLFNDIAVPRFDANGAISELFHVPISYAPKEKVLAVSLDNPDLTKQSAVSPLPRMSFEMSAPTLDAERMLNPVQTSSIARNPITGNYQHMFEPVPYDFHYTLWIYAKTVEDANKVFEQIVPFFKPEFPVKVELIPQMNIEMNIPVVLNSVSLSDSYDGDFQTRRVIVWTLEFTMKGYYFGPIMEDAIIKFANVNFYAPTVKDLTTAVGNSTPLARDTSQPGLTANGQPTRDITKTIPYQQINATDPYDYINLVYGDLTSLEDVGGDQINLIVVPLYFNSLIGSQNIPVILI